MKLSNIIIVLYLAVSAILFTSFFVNLFVWTSFFMTWLMLTIIFLYHLKIEKDYSPFLSAYITFNFLFFLLAPMVQIKAFTDSENLFPNYFPYSEGAVFYTNVLILISHIIFFWAYLFFKKRKRKTIKITTYKSSKYLPLNLIIMLIIGITTLVMSFDYLVTLLTESHWKSTRLYDLSVSSQLILKKVLFMMPFGALVLAYAYLKTKSKKKLNTNTIVIFFVLILFLALLLFFKNPLTEKRNAIGPIYITLLFLFTPKLLNSNIKSFVFLFFSLVILFPMISGLTHLDASIDQIIADPSLIVERYNRESITKTFNTLHYDAFANVMATVDYTVKNGLSYGYQILSGLLFFIPRSLWTSKPISTGELIGDYVIEDYGFEYSNLSNPIVAEGYINFGIFGVILLSFFLAYFVVKFMFWLKGNDPLKKIMAFYFAVHLMFLLRGDFTNGFSYFVGTLIGVLVVPKAIDLVLKMSFKKSSK
ncbi:O-antigen polymerase [Psychroserpens algicola]|uniref:Oligosaccharide repeat unit polymerase n=1 Tax=Psychroserpens algicola TaxID=1719034 RepID=A0ABT0HDB0_9FLAO|nr:O-antigen polymerase [Psychroserpens algicola]MCK8481792.1 oligosaccharide repeat unit polymerase [Psychroserpens algicola]